ncbi:Clp protease N-terminal domain-containing protein [Streptomyces sp. B21-102]|uniref:Clp protease N-terminal domain-containing protein n=1 Tax=unclassified Streptomyces TaxID=2593676 RepID=UPI002FF413CE
MQPRIPRQSSRDLRDLTAHATGGDPGLDAEVAAALASARRRALRDGDRQIDTAHLLHSLLEHDPQVRAAFDGGPQLARLLGYLVQRSIGYGLRWQGGVEDSGALPAVPVLTAPGGPGGPSGPSVVEDSAEAPHLAAADGFSPLAAAALEHARVRAAGRDGEPARGVDLLAAIVADPKARAVEVLTHAGVDAYELRKRIADALLEHGLLEHGLPEHGLPEHGLLSEGGAGQRAPEGCGTCVGGGDPTH